ncbi:MAG: substrate-binding domain-containing protein [Burkholderiales bacterium]
MKRFLVFAVILILMLCVCGCRNQAELITEPRIPAAGSAPSEPEESAENGPVTVRVECEANIGVGKMLSWMYGKKNEGVDIQFKTGDISSAIEAVRAGDAEAALFGLNRDELAQYEDMDIDFLFSDGIAIIVNPDNGAEDISLEQLEGILTGEITDWQQIGAAPGAISVYAGASPFLQRQIERKFGIALDDNVSDDYTSYKGDYGCEAVKNEAGGISFTSLAAAVGRDDVKVLSIGGVAPEGENIASGRYPLKRDYYILTAKEGQDGQEEQHEHAVKFAQYCKSDPDVAAYLYDKGYIKP